MTDVCMSLYRHVVGDSSDCMYCKSGYFSAGSVNSSCAWPRPAAARMVRGMVLAARMVRGMVRGMVTL